MRRPPARATAAALALAVSGLLPLAAPAQAGLWRGDEPAGDVVSLAPIDPDRSCGDEVATAAPDEAGVDITRLRVRHSPRVVRVDVSLRDLDPAVRQSTWVRLRTPSDSYLVTAAARGTDRPLRVTLGAVYDPDRPRPQVGARTACALVAPLGCRHLRAGASAVRDRVRVAVPRSCLDDPAWVRVAAEVYAGRGDGVLADAWGPRRGPLDGSATAPVGPFSPAVRSSS